MKCPYCKETIDDDSYYCDQCGKELHFCPDCGKPKQGSSCPACGADLVSGTVFFLKKPQNTQHPTAPSTSWPTNTVMPSQPEPISQVPPIPQGTAVQTPPMPQGTAVAAPPKPMPQFIQGNGWNLPLKEGVFGRTQGIYSEFGTQQYISGRHGQFRMMNGKWQVLDFGSTNGTFLNGQRLAPNNWYDLNLGDQLKIATTNFIIA
ncbi:MAG: FHA domain-containing protein [Bacteroidales bacterium]|nr:FHA domain-containing protein [Bacteroidales bacterium]